MTLESRAEGGGGGEGGGENGKPNWNLLLTSWGCLKSKPGDRQVGKTTGGGGGGGWGGGGGGGGGGGLGLGCLGGGWIGELTEGLQAHKDERGVPQPKWVNGATRLTARGGGDWRWKGGNAQAWGGRRSGGGPMKRGNGVKLREVKPGKKGESSERQEN